MSGIYGHSQRLSAAMPLIREQLPAYWKAIDPDLESARECFKLGVKLVVRHYGPWDDGDPTVITPAAFVDHCLMQPWWPYAWAIETPNEPHAEGKLAIEAHRDWMAEVVWRLHSIGKECIVGNWGTGWDGYDVPGATYYGCHEYGWPEVTSQSPWHAYRHRDWLLDDATLFITECGVTQAVEGRADTGWHSGALTPEQYAESIREYVSGLDERVAGVFVYQFGGFGDWASFECLGHPALEELSRPGGAPTEEPVEEEPMYPVWPVEHAEHVITHGSDAEHHRENLGCDIKADEGGAWLAVMHRGAEVTVVLDQDDLGTCGTAVEIQWWYGGQTYNLRYCHGTATGFHYESGTRIRAREFLGRVGMTGVTTGPHLHLAAAIGCAPGALLETGQRYPADTLLMEIIASYEEDEMTDYEEQQLHIAWAAAEWLESQPGLHEVAKAVKNAVRMAKGEAVEE